MELPLFVSEQTRWNLSFLHWLSSTEFSYKDRLLSITCDDCIDRVGSARFVNLLSPKVQFQWSPSCQEAFDNVKLLLASSPVLSAPDFDRPFSVAVDASESGAGAVLLQVGLDGVEHPVAYFSRKFNRHQQVYSTVEREALALILAVQHFEVYLGSSPSPIDLFTDHNPLVFIDRMRNQNQRIMRWSLILQQYPLKIQHIRGKDNIVADALSRV